MNPEKVYNFILKNVENIIGDKETTNEELDDFCYSYFGNKYRGTHSIDEIPKIYNSEMLIFNLSKSDEMGTHWVALTKENNNVYFYDSFGRNPKKLGFGRKKLKYDKKDGEQLDEESNCGQRCVTYLIIGSLFGFEFANEI